MNHHIDDENTIYDDESTLYDDNTTYYSHLEDSFIAELKEELIRKEIATKHGSDTKNKQQEGMMTTDEVAKLIQQLKVTEHSNSDDVDEKKAFSTKVGVTNINLTKPPSNVEKNDDVTHPQKTLQQILSFNGYEQEQIPFESIPKDFFLQMTDENMKAYTNEMVKAVRTEDMETLNTFLNDGKNLQCCNRFGESIISMACRNRSASVVDFLLNKAKVSIRICDDYGRTPLHDACWVDPDFKLIDMLVEECPDLFLICDKRGHSPLSYTQKEYHANWNSFLWKKKDRICSSALAIKIDLDGS